MGMWISYFLGVFFGLWIGAMVVDSNIIRECRKQHNVYECKVIAVPVEVK